MNWIFNKLRKPLIYVYTWMVIIYKTFINIILSLYCYKTIKIYLCNHLTIGIWKLYKKRVKFPHPVGIVIGLNVNIGYDCIIYQNVTIGTKDTANYKNGKYPKIGNNVIIYPNSVIIGDIEIGDNAVIGAGSIVLKNVPSGKVVFGNPAKLKL